MNDASRERVLFERALEHPPADREEFLARACPDDSALCRRVLDLLAAHDRMAGTPTTPAPALAGFGAAPEAIGPYRILATLGEGGMGVVYDAEQTEPIRRRVAIKIIKPGMDSAEVLRRFEAERQTLALLDHPHVARVVEAGATVEGRPYFVMEHVDGQPLTLHADRCRLSVAERLALFVDVCDAVQHAHTKGVIHRDLKPSNILVAERDGRSVPKVIDFGIAKALDSGAADAAFTRQGQMIGTLEYMSPEQAAGRDIDTRADVYSLGVILYELLTGAHPFDREALRRSSLAEAQRLICESETPRPSTRPRDAGAAEADLAERRRTDAPTLSRLLRGDLDWITMKALEKDRDRRYMTAMELGNDVRRHLAGEPVLAGPPGAAYRLGKFVRRNRFAVAAAGLLLAALIGGVVTTTWQALRARRAERTAVAEREEARRQAAIAGAVNRFLNDDLLAAVSPDREGIHVTMREVLDAAAQRVDGRFDGEPEVEAAVRETLGDTYMALGELRESEPHLRRAVDLRAAALGPDHPDTLSARRELGVLLVQQSRFDEAEQVLTDVLDDRRRVLGADDEQTVQSMSDLATVLRRRAGDQRAVELFREVLAHRRRTLGDDARATIQTMNDLAIQYSSEGRLEEAEPLMREAVERTRRVLGERHPDTVYMLANLAALLLDAGRLEEAEAANVEALALQREILGDEHPDTLYSINSLAQIYRRQKDDAAAEPLLVEALETRRRVLGDEHTTTVTSMHNLSRLYRDAGRLPQAETLAREALGVAERLHGNAHGKTLLVRVNLGEILARRGKFEESERMQRRCIADAEELYGADDWHVQRFRTSLARTLAATGRHAEAESLLLDAHARLSAEKGDAFRQTVRAAEALAELYESWGKPGEAARWRR